MQTPKVVNIQNNASRIKGINNVSLAITLFSIADSIIYTLLKQYNIAILTIIIGVLFGFIFILNKNGYFKISRTGLIISTNLGVLLFSTCLGFKSGIYLYLFSAPLLTYMLFDYNQRVNIYLSFLSYICTFITSYLIDKSSYFNNIVLNNTNLDLIYIINVVLSFSLCFILITYFSSNNHKYINQLTNSNKIIEKQYDILENDIIEKNILNINLKKTLEERELLLSEIHHRVKNNLAVITGLIELQSHFLTNENALQVLNESQSRIKSIALLHEKLYENNTLKLIDFSLYLKELIDNIKLTNSKKNINTVLEINNIHLTMEKGMPLGLILNELFINSCKHGFIKTESGNVWITINKTENKYKLKYTDDGIGFDYKKSTQTLGLSLIESFCEQLNGNFIFKREANKMSFELEFIV